jgi:hypothetical protein
MYVATLGDAGGYSVGTSINKFISKKLSVGVGYRYASCLKRPALFSNFLHKSITYIEPSISYYPFNVHNPTRLTDIVKGFNIKIGPTLFYGHFSEESAWLTTVDLTTGEELSRTSIIGTKKIVDVGYFVVLSYELKFTKKLFICANINFANL